MLGRTLLTLPDPVLEHLFRGVIGYGPGDIPAPITAPSARRRLMIAPANYAAQGYEWARAVETLPGVAACNLFVSSGGYGFRADHRVSNEVFQKSHRWGREQARAVVDGFTHVLVEAERPVLGRACRGDVRREHDFLIGHGVRVAYVAHGSDLRMPSRHADLDQWSPFRDRDWELLPVLQEVTDRNGRLLDAIDEPVFVVTPDLLVDRPDATWLPNCVEPQRWHLDIPAFSASGRPRVLHAPTNARIKGTDLIEPVVRRLATRRIVEYQRVDGVPASAMARLYASADVILEQFRLGIYSTTAIEGMAAGRLVVGHIRPDVRAAAESRAGRSLPIVEATVDTLEDILVDIADRPTFYAATAAQGPAYVRAVHSPTAVAGALQGFLGAVP